MQTIKEVSYLQGGRELCVTGTCILTASASPLGKAIRLFEGPNAYCSHAASVVRYPSNMVREERVTLIEALEHGLTPTYLAHYFKDFTGDLYLFVPDGLTAVVQEAFRFWLMDKMLEQTPYDYEGLIRQVGGRIKADETALFCSEAYGFALEYGGIPRLPSAPACLAPQPPDVSVWWGGTLYKMLGPFV